MSPNTKAWLALAAMWVSAIFGQAMLVRRLYPQAAIGIAGLICAGIYGATRKYEKK